MESSCSRRRELARAARLRVVDTVPKGLIRMQSAGIDVARESIRTIRKAASCLSQRHGSTLRYRTDNRTDPDAKLAVITGLPWLGKSINRVTRYLSAVCSAFGVYEQYRKHYRVFSRDPVKESEAQMFANNGSSTPNGNMNVG